MTLEHEEISSNVDAEAVASGGEPSGDEQLLVSYLDGELDEQDAASLEVRLTQEPKLRSRLHDLQRTWDLLDELPPRHPRPTLVESTIEMVVSGAKRKRRKWHRWPIRVGLTALIFVIGSLVTFWAVRAEQNRSFREFVLDLDFIENVDNYSEIDNMDFLLNLRDKKLFSEVPAND